MTLLFREMFATTGALTAAAPGQGFSHVSGTLHQRAGGPRLAGGAAASADLRPALGSAYGVFDIPEESQERIFAGGWYCFKSVQSHEALLLTMIDQYGNPGPVISVLDAKIAGGVAYHNLTPCPVNPGKGWIFLGIALAKADETRVNLRYYYKLPGEPMQSWGALNNFYITREKNIGLQAGCLGTGMTLNLRMGAACGYTFAQSDFSDVVYPPDILEPGGRMTWHVNPATGSDENDGTTPDKAWATVEKINAESLYAGFFASESYDDGDTLIINTGGKDLELPGLPLEFRTQGLTVKAAEGQTWIKLKGYRTLDAAAWMPTDAAGVYATEDTQLHTVMWEDDKFLHHPLGSDFASVRNEMAATPGSFWTDGIKMYVHPFGGTDPRTDGKRYERSYPMPAQVMLAAPDLNVQDIHTGKTCLAENSSHDALGGYCMGNANKAGKMRIAHCYLYYGSKHNLGLTEGAAGDLIEVEDVQVEQASPYPTFGGQTLLVSFNAGASGLGIRHVYRRCVSRANAGLVGSTEGTMSAKYPVFYSHNISGQGQFSRIDFVDCDFGKGGISGNAIDHVFIEGTRCGDVRMASDVTVSRSQLMGVMSCQFGRRLTMRHCIQQVGGMLTENYFAGHLDIQFCTFDATGVSSVQMGVPQASLMTRVGALNVIFRNNVVLMPEAPIGVNLFARLNSTDQLVFSNNAYSLHGNRIVYQHNQGGSISSPSLSQWQAMGQDSSSFEKADLSLTNYRPQPGSPLIAAASGGGADQDFSGAFFFARDDCGAYQTLPTSFADWRNRVFTEAERAEPRTQAEASYLDDGLSNLMKYALQLNPFEPVNDALMLARRSATGDGLNLVYQRRRDLSDVVFSFEQSSDLKEWGPAPMGPEIVTEDVEVLETVHCRVSFEGRAMFFRLKVSLR